MEPQLPPQLPSHDTNIPVTPAEGEGRKIKLEPSRAKLRSPAMIFQSVFTGITSQVKKLGSWSWKSLTAIAFVKSVSESRLLNSATRKLDSKTLQATTLLTLDESRQALTAICDWLHAPDRAALPSRVQNFVNHLQQSGFLTIPVEEEKKTELLDALENYIRNLNTRGLYWARPELKILEASIAPTLLLPMQANAPIVLTEEEFLHIALFSGLDSIAMQGVDPTKAFQELVKTLQSPEKIDTYSQLARLGMNEPFIVGDRLVAKSSPELFALLGSSLTCFDPYLFSELAEIAKGVQRQGGFSDVKQALDKGPVGIKTAADITILSFYVSPFLATIDVSKLSTEEEKACLNVLQNMSRSSEKHLFYLPSLHFTRDLDAFVQVENRLQEVQALRKQFDSKIPLELHQIPLFVCCVMLAAGFEHFLNESGKWPCETLNELRTWAEKLQGKRPEWLYEYAAVKALDEKELQAEFPPVMAKIDASLKAGVILEDQKLSFKEFTLFRKVSKAVSHLENVLDPGLYKTVTDYELLLGGHKQDPFIRVCLLKTDPSQITDKTSPTDPLWKRMKDQIVLFGKKIVCNFVRYGHANFMLFDSFTYSKHGLSNDCVYHLPISGHYNPSIEQFDINIDELMPRERTLSEEEKSTFKRTFFLELKKIITEQRQGLHYPEHPLWRIIKGNLVLSPTQRTEQFLAKDENRDGFCSEFICQSIIEAQYKACESIDANAPTSLSSFGIHKLEGLTPLQLKTFLVKKKILTPCPQPIQSR